MASEKGIAYQGVALPYMLTGEIEVAIVFGLATVGPAIVGSMGLGDVKLAVVTGFAVGALGWGPTMLAVLATFAVAGMAAVTMLLEVFGPIIIQRALIWAREAPESTHAA